ncbi:HIT-like protein [Rhodotorula sp. JG-1b]|nr:HIT-like protein [Rhodotorula sp. JG-1b]
MTSHFIDRFARRAQDINTQQQPSSSSSSGAPLGPTSAATSSREQVEQRELAGDRDDDCIFCAIVAHEEPARTVYEDEHCVAFFDIYPIRPGHTLLIPKRHYERVPHLPDDLSAHLGRTMPRLCRALGRAMEQPDMNIVSNQGYAQVVPHIHFHLVPAPRRAGHSTRRGGLAFQNREELDDETADLLAQKIRDELAKEAEAAATGESPRNGRGRL